MPLVCFYDDFLDDPVVLFKVFFKQDFKKKTIELAGGVLR